MDSLGEGVVVGVRYAAFKFETSEGLRRALEALEAVGEREPIEYDVVTGSDIIVVPARHRGILYQVLQAQNLAAREMKSVPLSELPADEQARRRGLLSNRKLS